MTRNNKWIKQKNSADAFSILTTVFSKFFRVKYHANQVKIHLSKEWKSNISYRVNIDSVSRVIRSLVRSSEIWLVYLSELALRSESLLQMSDFAVRSFLEWSFTLVRVYSIECFLTVIHQSEANKLVKVTKKLAGII